MESKKYNFAHRSFGPKPIHVWNGESYQKATNLAHAQLIQCIYCKFNEELDAQCKVFPGNDNNNDDNDDTNMQPPNKNTPANDDNDTVLHGVILTNTHKTYNDNDNNKYTLDNNSFDYATGTDGYSYNDGYYKDEYYDAPLPTRSLREQYSVLVLSNGTVTDHLRRFIG